MTVRRRLSAALVIMTVLSAVPALAAGSGAADNPRPGQIARERVDEVLRSLEKFVAALPRYGLPQIAENGDIVIPRVNPPVAGSVRQPEQPDVTDI